MTEPDPIAGLKPGRIVHYVFSGPAAQEVNRRRTTRASIAERLARKIQPVFGDHVPVWPVGAQAHIGNPVAAGDICPAMVVRVWSPDRGAVNLKVMLDGSDDYWATSVPYNGEKMIGTWHWMFEGQNTRYQPDRVEKVSS